MRQMFKSASLSAREWGIYAAVWERCPRSLSELARQSKTARSTLRIVCTRLISNGWLRLDREGNRLRPVAIVPDSVQEQLAVHLEEGYAAAQFKGEFLMKAFLDYAVVSEWHVDNARPDFLTNPATGERLEYDRYYLEGVAFEFNGSQHYEHTERFASARQVKETQVRDLIKKGRSSDAAVTLVVVRPHQLHPDVLRTLVPPALLPLRRLDLEGPYLTSLSRLVFGYAARSPR